MTLQHASLLLVSACLHFATLIAATEPAQVHEARQGPTSIVFPSTDSGSVSTRTSSGGTTTMSPTPSTSPSPSSSTLGPSSPTNSLNFTIHNMTTCTPGLISWKYGGEDAELLLSITNIGVRQDHAQLGAVVLQQLVDTNTSVLSFTWPSVNLTQGWYEVQGFVLSSPTVRSNSAPFFVSNGKDVSCLTSALSRVAAASKSNVASIVGGVIGAVVGAALVIIAGVFLWSRRRRMFSRQGGRKGRTWESLKFASSSIQPGGSGAKFNNNHFHGHSDSTRAILAGGKASVTTTPGGSDEDVIAVSEEKLITPTSSTGMSPLDALSTPVHYDRRASTYSIQTPTAVASEAFRSRVPSTRSSSQTLEQQAQRIRSSMETSIRHRSERLSMPTLPSTNLCRLPIPQSPTNTQPKEEYPLAPMTPTPVNRSISAGALSMTARRTSRKPVPHYDSSMFQGNNVDSVSTLTAGAESSQSHGTGLRLGTAAHGTPSDSVHKASFADGRPMHYLIPDMPPPQQD